MSVEMALDIWKCRLGWTFSFPADRLEMTSRRLVEIRETAISRAGVDVKSFGQVAAGQTIVTLYSDDSLETPSLLRPD